jgi:ribosomal protein S18 acetylase RimI-like enzyme
VPTIEWFEGPRGELDLLFALADDAPAQVRIYRDLGRVLVARDGPEPIGHLQLLGEPPGEMEVKSIAVREERRGAGVGRMLVERAVAVARQEGVSTLVVSTAAADTSAIRFYQRLGFRMLRVERDVFTREAGYPDIEIDGIPLRDRLWLSLSTVGS